MRVKREVLKFKTENELCDAFLRDVGDEWTVYPETAGFDILLVRKADAVQLGIEAKLRANFKVLAQALPDHHRRQGPDYRGVLVPACPEGFAAVCQALCLLIFEPLPPPIFDWEPLRRLKFDETRHWPTTERCQLPEFVPDVPAGVPGPIQLTTWKIKALRIQARLELQGHVTSFDWKELRIDRNLWVRQRWLRGEKHGRETWYYATDKLPDARRQHPEVYQQVLEQERALHLKRA